MKKIFQFAACISAAVALASCAKEVESPVKPMEEEIQPFHMTVYTDGPDTKTEVVSDGMGGYNVNWKKDDVLGVYEAVDGSVQSKAKSSPLGAGGAEATFSFNLTGGVSGSKYAYTFVHPSSALSQINGTYAVSIPSAQIFPTGSFDPHADVLVSKPQEVTERPTSLTAQFARLGGTGKMTITAPTTAEKVLWITLESRDTLLAGYYVLSPASGDLDKEPTGGENSLRLYPAADLTYTGTIDVWFRTTAVTLTKELIVTVQTDAKKYVKKLNLSGRHIVFKNGELSKFGVDMSSVEGISSMVDVLTKDNTNTSNSYQDWTRSDLPSEVTYWGLTCAQSGAIQCNTGSKTIKEQNYHYGIITTVSNRYVKSVTIHTTTSYDASHQFDIYACNDAYTSTNELWHGANFKGTKVGSIVSSSESEQVRTVVINDNYHFIGIRAKSNAIQAKKIFIEWSASPSATAVVTTGGTSGEPTPSSATLTGSYTGATGAIYEAGFYWDETETSLDSLKHPERQVVSLDALSPGATFTAEVSSLNENTTYYYKAYVLEYDGNTGSFTERYGTIRSFTTRTKAAFKPGGWLELPTTTVVASTTTSSREDLYMVTHRAMMIGSDKPQRNYTILYDPEMYASYWVAYPLCNNHLGSGREESWDFDPEVPESKQTNIRKGAYGVKWPTAAYDNNYFARGHQLPNADRNGVDAMMAQTYYSTNLTPQLQYGFNGDIWKNLEDGVRNVVKGTADTVYVVTGAAFRKVGGSEPITKITSVRDNKLLPVPNYYWKVLLKVSWSGDDVTGATAIGFWLDHWATYSTAIDAYEACAVSVDQIEAWTGFDFFSNLSTSLQDGAEAATDWAAFKAY
jgi:endonuclease G